MAQPPSAGVEHATFAGFRSVFTPEGGCATRYYKVLRWVLLLRREAHADDLAVVAGEDAPIGEGRVGPADFAAAPRGPARRLDKLRPADLVETLGDSNSRIIDSLVSDMVASSLESDSIGFSPEVLDSFRRIRDFNYERIYSHPEIRNEKQRIENAFRVMFEYFLKELESGRTSSIIFPHFLNNRSEQYLEETSPPVKVRDYIATMTDRYFTKVFEDLFLPRMPR